MSIIDQALDNSVLRAEFQAQDRDQNVDIRIYQVMHKPAPQVANNARYLSTTPLIYNDRKHS